MSLSLPPPPPPPPPFIFLPVLPSLSPSFQVSDDCIQIVERGFGADAVTLAEEIWKACERESLEALIEAAFEAIRSRGTDSHNVYLSAEILFDTIWHSPVATELMFDVGYRICIFFIYLALWPYYWPCDSTFKVTRTRATLVFIFGFWMLDLANNTVQGPARALLADLSSPDQHNVVNAIFCSWMAVGNILGYSAGASGKWNRDKPPYSCKGH
ncbi:Sucrose transport protein [Arachis hypogaea]|nr:Sucrose transport protein [Arachis hypogaea]